MDRSKLEITEITVEYAETSSGGATTIWERWDSILPDGSFDASGMNSLNHYAYGTIGDWLYRKVAGINLIRPGYKEILISPTLTRGLTEVEARYESMYGTVASRISCRDGKITVDVEIPANTTAILELPEREEEIRVGSGRYHFEYGTVTRLDRSPVSMNSTVAEILEQPGGTDAIRCCMPEILEGPMSCLSARQNPQRTGGHGARFREETGGDC